ncbi:hypothetical protein DID78_05460 [Candidatus Marinamargulisbacteria bacterium SCGC AG-343-D04]|nr:hypothetical protein DID78_05460 [Candidatus Marinamargulisbacteria bacterium SCGC AG-343-D04]
MFHDINNSSYDGGLDPNLLEFAIFDSSEIETLQAKTEEQLLVHDFNVIEGLSIIMDTFEENPRNIDMNNFDQYLFMETLDLLEITAGELTIPFVHQESYNDNNSINIEFEVIHKDTSISKAELVYVSSSGSSTIPFTLDSSHDYVSEFEIKDSDGESSINLSAGGPVTINIYDSNNAIVKTHSFYLYNWNAMTYENFGDSIVGSIEDTGDLHTSDVILKDHVEYMELSWPAVTPVLTDTGLTSDDNFSVEYWVHIVDNTGNSLCNYSSFHTDTPYVSYEDLREDCPNVSELKDLTSSKEYQLIISASMFSESFEHDIGYASIPFQVKVDSDAPDTHHTSLHDLLGNEYVVDLKVDDNGYIFVLLSNQTILKLDPSGTFVSTLTLPSPETGEWQYAETMVIHDNNLHVYDAIGKIYKLDTNGVLDAAYEVTNDPNAISYKSGFDVNKDGDYLFLDNTNVSIFEVDSGALTKKDDFAHGHSHDVRHLAVDSNNQIFIGEIDYWSGDQQIHVTQYDGTTVGSFGEKGEGKDKLGYISDIIIGEDDKIMVSNYDNAGVQAYGTDRSFDKNLGYDMPNIDPFEQTAIQKGSSSSAGTVVGISRNYYSGELELHILPSELHDYDLDTTYQSSMSSGG